MSVVASKIALTAGKRGVVPKLHPIFSGVLTYVGINGDGVLLEVKDGENTHRLWFSKEDRNALIAACVSGKPWSKK